MTTPTVTNRLQQVRLRLAAACGEVERSADGVTVVAVGKGFPPAAIREAVEAGIRHIGENRVQEAAGKRPQLAGLPGVTWHMVGHLQTNKVKTAVELFDIIQSVDSFHLAEAISKRAPRTVPVFLEVNVAEEPQKYGFLLKELPREYEAIARLPRIQVRGLMTVAPAVRDPELVRPVFRRLRECAHTLGLRELSMGMSDDFEVAIQEGATHVRLGRAIFGERE